MVTQNLLKKFLNQILRERFNTYCNVLATSKRDWEQDYENYEMT